MKTISKILSVVLCLAVVMAMFVIGASAADPNPAVLDTTGWENSTPIETQNLGAITITGAKGAHSSSVPTYFSNGSAFRVYKGNTITITADPGCTITSITVTVPSEQSFAPSVTNGTLDGTTITADAGATEIVLTFSAKDRFSSMSVAYSGTSSAPECTSHVPSSTYEMESDKHWQVCTNQGCGAKVNEDDHADTGACVCGLAVTPIATVLADTTTGDLYRVTGTVTCVSGKNLFIENGTSAINIYNASANWSGYAVGDKVTATGTYGAFKGLKQLTSPVVYKESSGNTVNYLTSIAGIDDSDIGKAIKLEGVSLMVTGKDGSAWVLSDGTNTINWFATLGEGQSIVAGDTVTALTGAISTYDGIQIINAKGDATIAKHTCDSDGIDKDADKHWAVCSKCGEVKGEKQDHTNAWKADTTGHYEECSVCGTKTDACTGALTTTYKTNATHHWYACTTDGCEYITGKGEHTKGADDKCTTCAYNMACVHEYEPKQDDTHHWNECKHCGDIEGGVKTAHTVKYDENQHWIECSCGKATEKEYHTLSKNKCACGYEKIASGYFKVTDGKLTSGKYVMVLTNGYAPTKMDGTYLLSGQPTIKGNQVTNPEEFVVTLTVEGNKVVIKDANGKIVVNKSGENSLVANATEGSWTWEYKDGYFRFHDGKDEARYLASNSQLENKFRAYRANSSQADSQTNTFVLYKLNTNSSTGDNSVISVAVAAAALSVLGCAVLISKKKEF